MFFTILVGYGKVNHMKLNISNIFTYLCNKIFYKMKITKKILKKIIKECVQRVIINESLNDVAYWYGNPNRVQKQVEPQQQSGQNTQQGNQQGLQYQWTTSPTNNPGQINYQNNSQSNQQSGQQQYPQINGELITTLKNLISFENEINNKIQTANNNDLLMYQTLLNDINEIKIYLNSVGLI